MTGLSHFIEMWLIQIPDWARNGTEFKGLVGVLLAVTLVTLAVLIVLLRINHNLNLGS